MVDDLEPVGLCPPTCEVWIGDGPCTCEDDQDDDDAYRPEPDGLWW